MNAISADARVPARSRAPRQDDATLARRRRRAILASIAAAFLGIYVLGVSWFANQLQSDMQRNLQLAPAVEDVAHR